MIADLGSLQLHAHTVGPVLIRLFMALGRYRRTFLAIGLTVALASLAASSWMPTRLADLSVLPTSGRPCCPVTADA